MVADTYGQYLTVGDKLQLNDITINVRCRTFGCGAFIVFNWARYVLFDIQTANKHHTGSAAYLRFWASTREQLVNKKP